MAKKHRITFRPTAIADLDRLYDYVAAQSGTAVAGSYIDRIEAVCLGLEHFPNRGIRRDDIQRGLRILGFERRVAIAFRVTRTEVVIIGVVYGGQDLMRALGDVSLD